MTTQADKRRQRARAAQGQDSLPTPPSERREDQAEVDHYAAVVIGSLAGASTQDVRRRAIEKARRMLGRR